MFWRMEPAVVVNDLFQGCGKQSSFSSVALTARGWKPLSCLNCRGSGQATEPIDQARQMFNGPYQSWIASASKKSTVAVAARRAKPPSSKATPTATVTQPRPARRQPLPDGTCWMRTSTAGGAAAAGPTHRCGVASTGGPAAVTLL